MVPDSPHSLATARERWPVVDGIPYLRTDSEGLVAVALDHLDAGCPDDALVALLTDQDAWWTGPATDLGEVKRLVRERDTLTLREAMALLRMGPVADYFAYRWVDPTYLAGLALLEAHWDQPASAFELACGIGHYLRELTRRGVACMGGDVVFAKCWLAKHWVASLADYVVFDAGQPWPVADERFDLVMCHDAFYFLPEQDQVAARMRMLLSERGSLAVSHLHNAGFTGGSRGPARPTCEWQAMFHEATVYNERDLLGALLASGEPAPSGWRDDDAIEAYSLVERAEPPRSVKYGIAVPADDAALVPNPLILNQGISWPSDRWRDEYGEHCPWAVPSNPTDDARTRRIVDLPGRW